MKNEGISSFNIDYYPYVGNWIAKFCKNFAEWSLYEAYEESLKIYIRENRLIIENLPKDTIIEIYSNRRH